MRNTRFWINTLLLTALACSRETPAPPPTATTAPPVTTTVTTTSAAPAPAPATKGTYEEALLWLRSAPSFHFVMDAENLHVEGDMLRRTVGAETVHVRVNGQEWRATAGRQGVSWERRQGASWKEAPAPEYGNSVYQRVTLPIDPQKKEGAAQLVATEAAANHYRFTDLNSGLVHDLWVNTADGHVERMKIGDTFEMRITVP
jgi:hypothetical protein